MKLLRLVFSLPSIYHKQTLTDMFYHYLIAGIVLASLSIYLQDKLGDWLHPLQWFCGVLLAYGLLRSCVRSLIVRHILTSQGAGEAVDLAGAGRIAGGLELDGVDNGVLLQQAEKFKVYRVTFDSYRQTRHERYLAKQSYYTLLEVRLQRQLPHILFDSKTAKSSQFKKIYLSSQRISVQGGFDTIFDTYVPPFYTIDSLSFVTPEVMETLVAARNYDIEILDDRLLLYAPLLTKKEIEVLKVRGQAIATELDDNIDTYRDDRLTGHERKTRVSPFGRTLLRNPVPAIVTSVVLGLAVIGSVVGAITWPEAAGDWLKFGAFMLLAAAGSAFGARIILEANRRAIEGYRVLYQTDRGKPRLG